MKMLGIPMHQMSVTGLIIALGLLIDNAIVMVDEVRERLHQGMTASDAIIDEGLDIIENSLIEIAAGTMREVG